MSKNKSNDFVVSVKLPHSLLVELKTLQKTNHFMDLSDEIRYVVRESCLNLSALSSHPSIPQIPQSISFMEQKKKEKLISELTGILDELKQNEDRK